MTRVDIEYRVPCGLLDDAIDTERALLNEFGQDLEGVGLTPGNNGVFKIRVNSEVVWDKDVHGSDLNLDLIAGAVREHAPTA
jgi:selenoprotein W-related protein